MRRLLLILFLAVARPLAAQTQPACAPTALPGAARTVAALRHALAAQAVPENDPRVPTAVAMQLAELQSALTAAAGAALRCAPLSVTPEALETTLGEALHANLPTATEIETRDKKDLGAYGSDLAVQVFPLASSPRYLQVTFRYGIECGDDNLTLVFAEDEAKAPAEGAPWHEVLRWGAPSYRDVSGAYGDFILMAPLSGFARERNWRFVVAHGQPGCGVPNGPSHFTLDVLEPTANPDRPTVVWHLEHSYLRDQIPRLATTEDTLTFELAPPELGPPERAPKAGKTPAHTDTFRYRIGKNNQVEPLTAAAGDRPPS